MLGPSIANHGAAPAYQTGILVLVQGASSDRHGCGVLPCVESRCGAGKSNCRPPESTDCRTRLGRPSSVQTRQCRSHLCQRFRFAVLVLPRQAAAQAGDLIYERSWSASIWNPYYWNTWIDIWEWDDFGDIDDDHSATDVYVYGQIPARSVSDTVHVLADFWEENPWTGWQTVSESDSSYLPSGGAGSVNILASTFIEQEWVGDPIWVAFVYGGDDRQFGYYAGTSRTFMVADVLNSATDSGGWLLAPTFGASLSTMYDRDTSLSQGMLGGSLLQAAKDDWEWGGDKKLAWSTASVSGYCTVPEHLYEQYGWETSSIQFDCNFYGANPLVFASPDIDVEFTLRLTFGNDQVQYDIHGGWDGFPSMELYLNGITAVAEHDNGDLLSLVGGASTSFSGSGGF